MREGERHREKERYRESDTGSGPSHRDSLFGGMFLNAF